ncbi:HD domain-containing phosphohydrolase [Shewanella sp. FJAT-52076]|uniref:response regulator n=1 Tax=Shewanella sp. FJAT-52076 TaxID=2864202 RepID=UPI001C6610DE|nr:HD domain-containing phosphohydrolase [Shewanella sp. FJAT-52076]QYJ74865.1 response regulator [Shewanella sp. FJAT-52076]
MQDLKPLILVVDDEAANLRVLKQILQDEYQLSFAKSGQEALRLVGQKRPDLILLDIMMPDMTGLDLCKMLKANAQSAAIPVIFVTALSDEADEATGFAAGAVDYITKPVSSAIVRARVRTHLSLVQAEELKVTRLKIIQRLGRAAEFKDNETGMHVMRMSHYAKVLARAYGLGESHADMLLHAAPMHDIGKIGIADHILLKPGKLTEEEFEVMKTHPQIGADIIGEDDSVLMQMARTVALTHHEKWDGSGYPNGLSGEAIPVEGRIVAIADVFDALTSDRPYKKAWSIEDTLRLMREQKGRHFEPLLVELLEQHLDTILDIKQTFVDE